MKVGIDIEMAYLNHENGTGVGVLNVDCDLSRLCSRFVKTTREK